MRRQTLQLELFSQIGEVETLNKTCDAIYSVSLGSLMSYLTAKDKLNMSHFQNVGSHLTLLEYVSKPKYMDSHVTI